MSKLWCKIWNTFLMIFNTGIEGIGTILKTIGTVFVDVLGAVLDAGSSVFGSLLKSPLGLVLLVGGGLWLMSSLGDDKPKRQSKKGVVDEFAF